MKPKQSYLICFTPRSGSNLLAHALMNTGIAGRPEEYFHEETTTTVSGSEAAWLRDLKVQPFEEALARVIDHGTDANGIFAAKVDWTRFTIIDQELRATTGTERPTSADRIAGAFPDVRYVWITRRDKVSQAVSSLRARQSGVFLLRVGDNARRTSESFNSRLISAEIRRFVLHEAAWSRFFAESKIVPCTVVYEDLILDYEHTVRRVLAFLDIAVPQGYTFPPPALQKQRDKVSEEWVRRYHAVDSRWHEFAMALTLPSVLPSRGLRTVYLSRRIADTRVKIVRRAQRALGRVLDRPGTH